MGMKLIVVPLAFLFVFAILASFGLGSDLGVAGGFGVGSSDDGYFDADGHKVCDENFTYTGEWGHLLILEHHDVAATKDIYWCNQTDYLGRPHIFYESENHPLSGANIFEAFENSDGTNEGGWYVFFQITGVMGFVALIFAAMSVGLVVGIKAFGFGISESVVKIIVIGGMFISLWTFLSVVAWGLILSIPIVGPTFYLFLSLLYTLGIGSLIGGGT